MTQRNLYDFPADSILVLDPGDIDPDKLAPEALRRLPGKRIRWVKPGKLDQIAVNKAEPGDLLVLVRDLDHADQWYQALLRADGVEPPWITKWRERHRTGIASARARRAAGLAKPKGAVSGGGRGCGHDQNDPGCTAPAAAGALHLAGPNNAAAGMTAFVEKRQAAAEARARRAEDLGIAVDMIVRAVPAIDDFLRILESSGAAPRLVRAIRAELGKRRGGGFNKGGR